MYMDQKTIFRAGKMIKALVIQVEFHPWVLWWKEKANSQKWSSPVHCGMHILGHTHINKMFQLLKILFGSYRRYKKRMIPLVASNTCTSNSTEL